MIINTDFNIGDVVMNRTTNEIHTIIEIQISRAGVTYWTRNGIRRGSYSSIDNYKKEYRLLDPSEIITLNNSDGSD